MNNEQGNEVGKIGEGELLEDDFNKESRQRMLLLMAIIIVAALVAAGVALI